MKPISGSTTSQRRQSRLWTSGSLKASACEAVGLGAAEVTLGEGRGFGTPAFSAARRLSELTPSRLVAVLRSTSVICAAVASGLAAHSTAAAPERMAAAVEV